MLFGVIDKVIIMLYFLSGRNKSFFEVYFNKFRVVFFIDFYLVK